VPPAETERTPLLREPAATKPQTALLKVNTSLTPLDLTWLLRISTEADTRSPNRRNLPSNNDLRAALGCDRRLRHAACIPSA